MKTSIRVVLGLLGVVGLNAALSCAPTPETSNRAVQQAMASRASATLGVNDYPFRDKPFDSGLSPLRFYYRNCTDFAAWRLNQARGGSLSDIRFTWGSLPFPKSPSYPNGDGNARGWMEGARAGGYRVDTTPSPGAIAWRGPIPYSPKGPIGHVAVVVRVNSDGTIDYEDYNSDGRGSYQVHHHVASTTFNRYLHIADVTPPVPTTTTTTTIPSPFGSDLQPVVGDFNGDSLSDIALRRVSTGTWYFRTRTATGWDQTSTTWDTGAG